MGEAFLKALSGFLKPNGPSYNGQTVSFSLLLAPFTGDEPPKELQAEAAAHFYPPTILFHAAPAGIDALLPADIRTRANVDLRQSAIAMAESVPEPAAFLANPSHHQVDMVWEPSRDVPVTGYEVAWRKAGEKEWHGTPVQPSNRCQVTGLEDGQEYIFKLRAACGSKFSSWTHEQVCVPGAVTGSGLPGLSSIPIGLLIRILARSLWSVIRVKISIDRS